MITLNLKKKSFKSNDKWPLLYVVAEIYNEESNCNKSLTNLDIAKITKEKYGINIERRTVSQYVSYLEDYFDFKFVKSGYGKYLQKEYESTTILETQEVNKNHTKDKIKTYKSDVFKKLEKNIAICEKGINQNVLLKYRCPKYITQKMTVVAKTIVLIPIKIFKFNLEYFLLAYFPPINNYYFVNLNKTTLGNGSLIFESAINIKKTLPPFDLNSYLTNSAFIASGRTNWQNILSLYEVKPEYYEEPYGIFSFETNYINRKIPIPEVLTILEEIYGEENIIPPEKENGPWGSKIFTFGINFNVYYKMAIEDI